MPRRLKNIRPWKGGWQASTYIGDGKSLAKSFPLNTPVSEMRAWIDDTSKQRLVPSPLKGSFGADIETYKRRISALPTYKQKAAHLELWAHTLGRDRPRRSITATEIDAIMQDWLRTPSTPTKGRPSGPHGLDPQTVRKRRTSLLSLFVTLDGKAAENPVRGTRNPVPPKPEIRGTDYATIARILEQLPMYRDTAEGQPVQLSKTRLRIAVLAYTGLPPGMLAKVTAPDLNLAVGTVRVGRRAKGGGVEARTLPLTPEGLKAFRAFHVEHLYGTFSVEAVNKSFQRACRRAEVTGLTLYDLRHSFGAQMYRTTKDLKTVGRFLLHTEGSTQTARYAKAADSEVDRAAAAGFCPGQSSGQNNPRQTGQRGTIRDHRHTRTNREKSA